MIEDQWDKCRWAGVSGKLCIRWFYTWKAGLNGAPWWNVQETLVKTEDFQLE